MKNRFIIIDDQAMNNLLARMIIKKYQPDSEIIEFTKAQEALFFLQNENSSKLESTINNLFLDINMPDMDGWGFLEGFEKLSDSIKKQIKIFMLSSSLSQQDIVKATSNKNVQGYISKPLNEIKLTEVVNK